MCKRLYSKARAMKLKVRKELAQEILQRNKQDGLLCSSYHELWFDESESDPDFVSKNRREFRNLRFREYGIVQ